MRSTIYQTYYHDEAMRQKIRVRTLEEGELMPDGWSKTKPTAEDMSPATAAPVAPEPAAPAAKPKASRGKGGTKGGAKKK
jgi:hypothetical protein